MGFITIFHHHLGEYVFFFFQPPYTAICKGPITPFRTLVGDSRYFAFSPRMFGERIQFDEHIFQMGGVKPPTRTAWAHLVPQSPQPSALRGFFCSALKLD